MILEKKEDGAYSNALYTTLTNITEQYVHYTIVNHLSRGISLATVKKIYFYNDIISILFNNGESLVINLREYPYWKIMNTSLYKKESG